MNRLIKQICNFGIVGFIATALDYGLMIVCHECFGIDILISSTVSFALSTVFNYLASMKYVFKHKSTYSTLQEFCIFAILSIIGLMLNTLVMWLGEAVCNALAIDYGSHMIYIYVKVLATGTVLVWNFVSRKLLLDAS
ncbi:GtrA family protein [Fannyhessea vaginae]|uniref:GtrA family protein n=1 Tax=Fannyhessea vaginae TaxID=82135 RepID=UPI003A7FFE22